MRAAASGRLWGLCCCGAADPALVWKCVQGHPGQWRARLPSRAALCQLLGQAILNTLLPTRGVGHPLGQSPALFAPVWSVGKVMLKAQVSLHLPLRAASAWNLHPTESGY